MPLTLFQKGVAHILAKHRNPESHLAGGAVINRGEDGSRKHLPAEEIGCFYLDTANHPVTSIPDEPSFPDLIRHRGSIRGAWPKIS